MYPHGGKQKKWEINKRIVQKIIEKFREKRRNTKIKSLSVGMQKTDEWDKAQMKTMMTECNKYVAPTGNTYTYTY